MSIKNDQKSEMKGNDYTMDIIEADELIAVWCYRQSNRFTRSVDFSRVPQEWRYSAPPSGSHDCMPCHVSYWRKKSVGYSCIKPDGGSQRRSSLPMPDLTELDAVGFARRNVAPHISPILDSYTLSLVCKDLGLHGKAIPKVIKGRQYIILTGYAGFRNYLPGTIYTAKNRKIIQMAIGELGLKNMVKNGARLTIYLTVPLTILECILRDQATLSQIIGHVCLGFDQGWDQFAPIGYCRTGCRFRYYRGVLPHCRYHTLWRFYGNGLGDNRQAIRTDRQTGGGARKIQR